MEKSENNGSGDAATKNLEDKIIRQIEYYFGDHNLRRDKFLQEAIKEDEGWVSLETLLKFNRLKTLSTDKDFIIEAIKKSPNNLVEVHEDGSKVRRSVLKPLVTEAAEKDFKDEPRSIYAKGFPQDTSLDDLIDFFDSHGSVENVFMRRFHNDKKFKGSVFALFKKLEDAEKFLNDKTVCYKGIPLAKETSKHYSERKAKETEKSKESKKNKKEKKEKEAAEAQTESKEFKFEMKKDCVLHLTGFSSDTSREDIKEAFDDHAKVAWVDFSRGDKEAWIRFQEEGMAPIALEKAKEANDGKVEIRNAEITSRLLAGDEEVEYWDKIKDLMKKMKGRRNQRQGRGENSWGRGKGRYGRDNRQSKRKRDNEERETYKPKSKKFDSDSDNEIEEVKTGDTENGSKSAGQKRKLESEESEKPSKAVKVDANE